ncbi:MAG: BMC domain-containing protein [Clostridium sp.]
MIIKALGMIEVDGYLAGVTAADAALKAANVTLIALEKVNAGITNVQVTGDIGAVKAAVDAGKMAAEELGMLRASHVIARLHEETLKLFPAFNKKNNDVDTNKNKINKEAISKVNNIEENKSIQKLEEEAKAIITTSKNLEKVTKVIINETNKIEKETEKIILENQNVQEEIKHVIEESNKKENQNKLLPNENIINVKNETNKTNDLIDYNSMKVDELRRMVRNLNLPHLTNNQIKFERKDVLIKILQEYGSEGEK